MPPARAFRPPPPPFGGRQAPPSRSNAGIAFAVLAVVGVATLLGAFVLIAVTTRSEPTTAAPDRPSLSAPQAPPVTAVETTTDSPTSTARPTVSATTTTTTRSAPPTRPPQKVVKLGDNPLFTDIGLAPVDCGLPPLATDVGAQTAFFRAAVDCLNRSWLPALTATGLPATPPELVIPTGPYSTPCGNKTPTDHANYCEGVIYMPPRYFTEVEQIPASRPAVYLGVLAHEYGHHVQELAGVMDAAWGRRYEVGVTSPAGLEISRRNELGATCFGGMFFASVAGRASVTQAMLAQAQQDAARRGDHARSGLPPDHGTPRNNGAWFEQGMQLNRVFQCNTWTASPASVS